MVFAGTTTTTAAGVGEDTGYGGGGEPSDSLQLIEQVDAQFDGDNRCTTGLNVRITGLNAQAASGAPVGSVQQNFSAGTYCVGRPTAGAPTQLAGAASTPTSTSTSASASASASTSASASACTSTLARPRDFQIAAYQPSGPAGRDAIPLGLARELSDLFVAKVMQARKLNGAPALPRPAPCSSWDEEDEPVEDHEWPPFTGMARPVNRLQLSDGKPSDRADAPVMATLLLELPDDLLVQILASFTGRARRFPRNWHQEARAEEMTEGHALAVAGACCHVLATCARAAAKIVADRHDWRLLPVAGGTPMQHLSRLEHDTKLVRSLLIKLDKADYPTGFVNQWVDEVSLGNIGPVFIDAQVRQQHTLELGRLLILSAMRVGPDDPNRDKRVATFGNQLIVLMTQPGTPLDASWLAACVFPLVEMHMTIENRSFHQSTGKMLVTLLCYLEPPVLRSHPEIFEWVRMTLQASRRCVDGVWAPTTVWSAGLKAWDERCEAQGLRAGCDTETRDAKLEAILHPGVRGCFTCLSSLDMPVDRLWPYCIGREVWPAVYH